MKKVDEGLMREFLARNAKAGFKGDSWEKYLKGTVGALVVLEDGDILNIRKPSIETSFCYGESGYDMDDAIASADRARTSEDHFRWANLKDLDEKIGILEGKADDWGRTCVARADDVEVKDGIASIMFCGWWDRVKNEPVKEVSAEDRSRILDGYRKVRDDFAKRIETYLKRYGLSKVRSWTYWRDA